MTINITAVNDAPVNTVPATQATNEDTSKAITGLSIADVDAGSGSVTVTLAVTNGTLTVAGGSAAIANSGTSTVTLTGTLGAINSTLASNVTFVPNANFSGVVTLTMTTNDNGNSGGAPLSDVDTVTINITAVNDVPAFSGLNATPGYTEGGAAVVLDSNALLADIELDAANNYSGATLTLARNGGASSQDVFGANGTLSFSGSNVVLSGTTVGTFTNSGGTLVITFNGNATSARVDSVLQQLTYANTSDAPPASVQVNYTFSDGNAGAQGTGGAGITNGSITVGITAVNDAPVNTVPATQATSEDTSKAITGLSIADVDAGAGSVTVTLTVTNGTLTVAGGSAGIANSGTSTVTLTGTQAAINSTLASNVTFVPNANFSGAATLTMTTNDNGNSGGAPLSDVDTVTINISAVNDTPVTRPDSVITNVGTGAQVVIPTAWLLANDTDVETSPLTAVAGVGGATGGSVSGTVPSITFTDDGTLDGTFTYQANDGSLSGAAATVTIDNNSTATTTLVGTVASEIFIGGATSDTIRGGGGNDFINGGNGTDTLDFSDGTSGITFAMVQSSSDTVANLTSAGLGTDTYRNMENVIGTAFADTITASAAGGSISTGAGADTVKINAAGNTNRTWTVDLGSDAVQDTVIFNHDAVGIGNQTVVTVSNFDETDSDQIAVTLNGTSISNGFTELDLLNETISGTNRVIEIANSSLVASAFGGGGLTDDGNSGTIEDIIVAASIDNIPDGTYTFIVYSNATGTADAGVYTVTINGDNSNPGSGDMTVEHIATLSGVGFGALSSLNFASLTVSDPLILDLGDHGIHFSSVESGVSFDINGDGTPDQTAWTTGQDGILTLDLNGNGTIDSGAEIFSPYFAGGDHASSLAALASLDSNGDGVMDANDAEFANLTVWQDVNHDGVSQANELAGLADHGITSIDLQATPADGTIDGQQVLSEGTFTTANGGTGTFVEVAFDTAVGANDNAAAAHTTVLTDANAPEVISDYSAARGDVIDVTGLLEANFGPDSNLSDFVNVFENGTDVTIQIDQNGPASGAHFVDVAVLQGYGTSASDIVRIAFENAEQQIAV